MRSSNSEDHEVAKGIMEITRAKWVKKTKIKI